MRTTWERRSDVGLKDGTSAASVDGDGYMPRTDLAEKRMRIDADGSTQCLI